MRAGARFERELFCAQPDPRGKVGGFWGRYIDDGLALRLYPEVVAVGGDGDVAVLVGAEDGVAVEAGEGFGGGVTVGVELAHGDDVDDGMDALEEGGGGGGLRAVVGELEDG